MRHPYLIALTSLAVVVLVGCGEKDEDNRIPASSTANSDEASEKPPERPRPGPSRVVYNETEELARTTCSVIPRDVLAQGFGRASSIPKAKLDSDTSDNGIALLYVEDVAIRPVPLQRAAYNGCLDGLAEQAM